MHKLHNTFLQNFRPPPTPSLQHHYALSLDITSRGGLVVERLLHKKRHSATVDQIPLGTMIIILNKK